MSWKSASGLIRALSLCVAVLLVGCGPAKAASGETPGTGAEAAGMRAWQAPFEAALARLRKSQTESPFVIADNPASQKYVQFTLANGALLYNFPLAAASAGTGPYWFSGTSADEPALDVQAPAAKRFISEQELGRLLALLKELGLNAQPTFSVGTDPQGSRVAWMKEISGEFTGTDHQAQVFADRVFREVFLLAPGYAVALEEN